MATLAKSSDEIIKGLLGDLENENGHPSEATESSSGDEEEERKKKRKKEQNVVGLRFNTQSRMKGLHTND